MALLTKNWASGLVRNIAPTREFELLGPSLRGDFSDVSELFFFIPVSVSTGHLLLSFFSFDCWSCQNVRNPLVHSPVERELYGWLDAEVLTQSSVITSDHLPELCREMRLTQDLASERDYVLEAAGPFDRLPFQAAEDRTHFLWSYVELFTRLGVRLPFSDFQRDILTWCRVAASQLHLNG
ncbi:hypothetical protein PIB30_094123 [Stylosanthes scabra]|uniref:Uncharacterized protein n=1 Tax=Stylosanthes scabra TaxID=79078 RepID=A0ABU6YU99_9FABA|nr:hypothetical protein [Stylosanthes scabra]